MAQRDPRPEATRDASGSAPGAEVEPEILDTFRRAAALPNGLALLERAPIECVAVLLAIHPRAVERGRTALGHPSARAAAVAALAHARRRGPRRADGDATPRPSGPEELIREAERRPGGVELLRSASPESAAILFGVRPDLVLAARTLLAAREAPAPGADA